MARPRHQNGWLTEHANQLYGNYWRYVVDPVTGERKKKHASIAARHDRRTQAVESEGEAAGDHR